ncbi:MAG TPA: carbohydrate ABC transporter permease, partial [Candidatus Limiplasma sp.]|nr:carbohydrate ABC transporter permease [Candidatus Limiplasma sp.]
YALARLRFKGSNFIIMFIIALLIIPIESIVIPMLLMVNSWGIVDTYIVQILPFIADPLYIFLLYQFFRDLPKSLEEAAIIDGLSYFGIYRYITIPLSKPALVSVAILASIARWGEFLWPLLVTRVSTYRPLTVAMQQLFSIDPKYWGDIFAFATMMTLPLLIIFIIFQKHFVESIARTGIKG